MSRNFLLACAAAIVLIVAAYANSVDNSFHFDDSHVIVTNVYLHSLHNIPLFFTDAHTFSSLPQNSTYRPLVTLSLALDYARGHGLAPRAFHVTQIALMLMTGALLVVFFTPMTGRWIALFCATLFCLHTGNTETMNLISARSELLSTIGLLASFILYQRSPFARRTLLYLIPLAIGALAKAPLVVFAPLLFVYELLLLPRVGEKVPQADEGASRSKRAFYAALPSLILGIFLLIFLNSMNAPEWVGGGGSKYHYLITQPFIWLHYFRLFFLPIGLTADTDMTTFAHWYDTRAVAGYAFVAMLAFWIVRTWRREESRPIAFGLAWFAIALLPTSIFPLAEVANEHRIFFAYIGLVLAVVWWAMRYLDSLDRDVIAGIAALILIAHLAGTVARNQTWATEASLWGDVVEKSPNNGRAWMNYGLTQMGRGDFLGAKASFDRAAITVPNYAVLEINEGINSSALRDQIAAESHFRRALQLNADNNAHYFYARWLIERGRAPEAVPHAREALRFSPAFGDARTMLLRLSAAVGSPELPALEAETLAINPDDRTLATYPSYDAAFAASTLAIQRRDWFVVARACREALRYNARSADAWNNLGWSLQQLGFRAEAMQAYQQAVALQPGFERAQNNLRLLQSVP
jgi:tetratricopeptide (TPR) repeat protein